ncbi:MAG TPA: ThuA domain-containing protein [Solirubrobacter sp.]|nr:ThuA domain-containing protein [Solirubrobacter sp.]
MSALFVALAAVLALGAGPALANAGKVLVFTGTGGTPNASSADAVTAITALGAANDFTVDSTADKAKISADNLANYRAVVFVNSAGDALDAAGETALQDYVNGGGGWVGIGETALLEQGGAAFFNTLTGLTGARITGSGASSAADVEFLDRVHPATRQLPLLAKNQTETWYTWATNPTGTVHTVARVRGNSSVLDGSSVPNDAVSRFTGTTATMQPQLERPASWCRDLQQGRSFYTELGSTSDSLANADIRKHLLGAIQWAAGMVRGGCKATINSNYVSTRLTPQNPAGSNQYFGEMTKSALADDGRVFYGGRAICSSTYVQIRDWDQANTGLGCGTIHVWDPRVPGSNDQNPAKISMVANLSVFGAHGSTPEYGQTSTTESGLVGMVLDPDFTKGRPYIYVQYYPYWGGEQGKDAEPRLGPGFDRRSYKGEKRISRFTYDDATKSLVAGSEKVIFSYMSQVYSCCHNGAGMAFDSKGNLYVTNGDSTPNGTSANGANNQSNNNNGGYVNPDPHFTLPCPGAGATTHCGDVDPADRPADTGPLISYGDARSTSGNTNVYEGKIIRIKPLADPGSEPGIGKTYTIPTTDAPNGPNLFAPDSEAVTSGKAKPEIFAMGVRSNYTIHIDKKTDAITTAWIGPDMGSENPQWGPAKTENATMMNSAGNWGWPYCQAGNRWSYRAKLPNRNGGEPAPFGHPNTVGGGADGQTGGYFDCRGPIVNDSPYNTGLETIPAPKPVNIWYGPQGGCYSYKKNANGIGLYSSTNSSADTARLCPWIIGGSQAPIDGGIYRRPAGDNKTDAWPSYWDGRWFMVDFAQANATRHALLMDPATQFQGGQPVAADSLYGIVSTSIIGNTRPVFMDFGADGALYVGSYGGGYYVFNNSLMGIWRFSYVGGPDTPGPDPKASVPASGSTVTFDIGKSGGVSYTWDFGDGSPAVTTQDASVSHTYRSGGSKTATLTVNYADGDKASADVVAADVPAPLFVEQTQQVGATVPLALSLTLGAPATFGGLTPAIDRDYDAFTTAHVLATSGDAALTVADPSDTATGRLTNGAYALTSPLQVKASSTVGTAGAAFANVGGSASPTSLVTYARAANDPSVTLAFKQHVAAGDALRAGQYSKTLTFTLSTTTP